MNRILTCLTCIFLSAFLITNAQPGTLDPTFNPSDIGFGFGDGATSGYINISALQSDGKILIGGQFQTYNGVSMTGVARLNVNGTLDTSFTSNVSNYANIQSLILQQDGKILIGGLFGLSGQNANNINFCRINSNGTIDSTFSVGYTDGIVNTIVLQSDGKIIIGGSFTNYHGSIANRIARINTDGTIDSTFNSFLWELDGIVKTIGIQASGKLIVCGEFSSYGSDIVNNIVRLNTDGSIDVSFVTGSGTLGYDLTFSTGTILTSLVQSDGKVIIGGNFTTFNGVSRNRILRLNTNGSIDATFNVGAGANGSVTSISYVNNGKFVIVGDFSSYNGSSKAKIALINSNGSFDSGFMVGVEGANGKLYSCKGLSNGKIMITSMTPFSFDKIMRGGIARLSSNGSIDPSFNPGTGFVGQVTAIGLQTDGKIMVGGGFSYCNGNLCRNIARLNINGTFDPSFVPGSGPSSLVNTLVTKSNGKIIIGGLFYTYDGSSVNYFTQLNSNGSLDLNFSSTGANDWVATCITQNNGKIIVGGNFTTFNGYTARRIVRLNSQGTTDPTFISGNGANNVVSAIAVQTNGSIIIGGNFTTYNGISINRIARLNSNGSLDSTFNVGSGANYSIESIAIQNDGKILIGGNFSTINGIPASNFARLNSDGTLDLTFISGIDNVSLYNTWISTIRIDSDNKIFAGGKFSSYNGVAVNNYVQVNSDGTLNTNNAFGTSANNQINTQLIQPNGNLLIGGLFTGFNGVGRNRIARIENCISSTIVQISNICQGGAVTVGNNSYYLTGNYTDTLTNVGGCDSIIITQLTVNPLPAAPTVSAVSATTFCQGDSMLLIGNNGSTWSNGAITNDIVVSTSGNYYVINTNSCGSDTSNIISVTVNPLPNIGVMQNNNTLSANQDSASYQWINCNNSSSIITQTNQTFTPTVGGSFAVAISYNGCADTSACYTITIADTSCHAQFTLYADTITPHHYYALNQCSGTGTINYVWSWGDSSANSTGPYPSHQYDTAGYYNICVTINDSLGCTSTYCDSSNYIARSSTSNTLIWVNVVNQLPSPIMTSLTSKLNETESNISIFPNPANSILHIKCELKFEDLRLKIFDSQGNEISIPFVNKQTGEKNIQNIELNIQNLSSGLYFVKVGNNLKRFVKE